MRYCGNCFDVDNIIGRIADGFGIQRPGFRGNRLAEILRVVGIDESGVDAHLAEGYIELRKGTAVQRFCRYQLIALLHQRQDRGHLCGHAGADAERGATVFQ